MLHHLCDMSVHEVADVARRARCGTVKARLSRGPRHARRAAQRHRAGYPAARAGGLRRRPASPQAVARRRRSEVRDAREMDFRTPSGAGRGGHVDAGLRLPAPPGRPGAHAGTGWPSSARSSARSPCSLRWRWPAVFGRAVPALGIHNLDSVSGARCAAPASRAAPSTGSGRSARRPAHCPTACRRGRRLPRGAPGPPVQPPGGRAAARVARADQHVREGRAAAELAGQARPRRAGAAVPTDVHAQRRGQRRLPHQPEVPPRRPRRRPGRHPGPRPETREGARPHRPGGATRAVRGPLRHPAERRHAQPARRPARRWPGAASSAGCRSRPCGSPAPTCTPARPPSR